jgi:hypothetical protein
MNKLMIAGSILLIMGSMSLAMQPEVIGGIRDGLAIGMMADTPVAKNVGLRFGLEANTGQQPLMIFFGGKFFLSYVGRSPMYLGVHGVGYTGGNNTDVGFGLSAIFNRAFNVNPMFMEFGVDVASTARLQAQIGYKIY